MVGRFRVKLRQTIQFRSVQSKPDYPLPQVRQGDGFEASSLCGQTLVDPVAAFIQLLSGDRHVCQRWPDEKLLNHFELDQPRRALPRLMVDHIQDCGHEVGVLILTEQLAHQGDSVAAKQRVLTQLYLPFLLVIPNSNTAPAIVF